MLLRKTLRTLLYSPCISSHRTEIKVYPENYEPPEVDERFNEKPYAYLVKKKKGDITDLLVFLQTRWHWHRIKTHFKQKKMMNIIADQVFMLKDIDALGSELSAAHFVLHRNGKVKFLDMPRLFSNADIQNEMIKYANPNLFIEEIDLSRTDLVFEGFDCLSNLQNLRKLDLSNCPYIDDWCLSRTYLFQNTLEHLDISGCHNVTEKGICALHRLKQLTTLVIQDTPNIQNKELVTLLLQDVIPTCKVIGVDYDDPHLLKRISGYSDQL